MSVPVSQADVSVLFPGSSHNVPGPAEQREPSCSYFLWWIRSFLIWDSVCVFASLAASKCVGVYNPFHTYKCINMTYINIHIFNASFLDSEQMTNAAVQRRKGLFFFFFLKKALLALNRKLRSRIHQVYSDRSHMGSSSFPSRIACSFALLLYYMKCFICI